MKNLLILILTSFILWIVLVMYVIYNRNTKTEYKEEYIRTIEQAYFEGQKDAINGDIRIKLNNDSIYVWTKSCWNNKTVPSYTPTYLDSKFNN